MLVNALNYEPPVNKSSVPQTISLGSVPQTISTANPGQLVTCTALCTCDKLPAVLLTKPHLRAQQLQALRVGARLLALLLGRLLCGLRLGAFARGRLGLRMCDARRALRLLRQLLRAIELVVLQQHIPMNSSFCCTSMQLHCVQLSFRATGTR